MAESVTFSLSFLWFIWCVWFIWLNETNQINLASSLARLMAGQWKNGAIPSKWDGKAAERIVEYLERVLVTM